MIEAASEQLGELIDELSLAARIDGDRYDPKLEPVAGGELAAAAVERLGEERVDVSGDGRRGRRSTRRRRSARSSALVQCALRHGGLDAGRRSSLDGAELRGHADHEVRRPRSSSARTCATSAPRSR